MVMIIIIDTENIVDWVEIVHQLQLNRHNYQHVYLHRKQMIFTPRESLSRFELLFSLYSDCCDDSISLFPSLNGVFVTNFSSIGFSHKRNSA